MHSDDAIVEDNVGPLDRADEKPMLFGPDDSPGCVRTCVGGGSAFPVCPIAYPFDQIFLLMLISVGLASMSKIAEYFTPPAKSVSPSTSRTSDVCSHAR